MTKDKDGLYPHQREFWDYLKDPRPGQRYFPMMTSINKPSDMGKSEHIARYFGPTIYPDASMVERVYNPRSPSRARRRAARGHPQHYDERPMRLVIYYPNGNMRVHPYYAKLLSENTKKQMRRVYEQVLEGVTNNPPKWSDESWVVDGKKGEPFKSVTGRWAGNRYRK